MRTQKVNQFERAYRAWPVLVQAARDKHPLTYRELGNALGIHHRPVRFVLAKIQAFCLEEGLPPLTSLVESQKGQVGEGFIAGTHDDIEEDRKSVYARSWAKISNPFRFAADGTNPEELAQDVANNTKGAKAKFARVKVRGVAQAIFRQALLRLYGRRCAITGEGGAELLQAAHIIPWSEATPAQRTSPTNGILLSLAHHRMFDLDWIRIGAGHRVHVNHHTIRNRGLNRAQLDSLNAIDGQKITLPQKRQDWPDLALLTKRYSSKKLRKKARDEVTDALD